MAALFGGKPKTPHIPRLSDKEIEEARRKLLKERAGGGRQGTILTGGAGVNTPILGNAASLVGGIL